LKKTTGLLLLVILLLALALRLWLWSRPDHPLANDETEYLPVARDLAHGRGFVFYDSYRWLRAPLYPLFLAFFLRIGGDNARVATLAQVLLSVATVYGFFLLARRLFPREAAGPAGLASALMAALLLPFATFPSLFMAETLFTLLFVAFLLAFLEILEAPPGRQWPWTIASGLLLGLAALTRAIALAFLPLAAAWLFLCLWRNRGRHRDVPSQPGSGHPLGGQAPGPIPADGPGKRLRMGTRFALPLTGRQVGLPLLLVLTCLAAIAPWSIRNAIVYKHFIPLDTGASYSLWAFYEPHETIDEINRQLEVIPNPADRQSYALQKWRERLREDPAIVLHRVPWTFRLLFRIKPIEDRFLPLPYQKPSLAYFVLALLLDDGLYALITVASLLAFLFAPAGRGKALALLWLLYNVALMLVLHGEARYRQLLFPAMIPYAGLALARGKQLVAAGKRGRVWRMATLSLLLLGWGYCFLVYSPWDWTWLNLRRGFYQTLGRVDWVLGRREEALRAYTRAIQADRRDAEACYDLGLALERLGRLEEAARAYRWGWDRQANYLPCSTGLGNVLRRLGRLEEARVAFRGDHLAEWEVVSWAWDHLSVPPAGRVEVGEGLDYGYVSGVHSLEKIGGATFRWTTREARFRLMPAGPGMFRLRFRLAAPRPGQQTGPVPAEVWVGGELLARWEIPPHWGIYETPAFSVECAAMLEVVLKSATFVPQEGDPSTPDSRSLGLQVDWAEIVMAVTESASPSGYNGFTPFP